ncbi:helix-turn-helix transcriptional regulator [Burkholderia glumae]|uniref:helix-turn-helix transcriptional regulator n=2 Tax=Burkholderia glumae TaxID=337 RepID=UPI003530406C
MQHRAQPRRTGIESPEHQTGDGEVGLGKSTIYRMIAAGDFPKSFVLAGTRTAWLDEDVDAWLAGRAKRAAVDNDGPAVSHFGATG